MRRGYQVLSAVFLNYFLHSIPVFFHAGGQLELGAGAVKVLLFIVNVEVVVSLEIIGEEAACRIPLSSAWRPRAGSVSLKA